jgi:hypothetical protein
MNSLRREIEKRYIFVVVVVVLVCWKSYPGKQSFSLLWI